MAASTAILNSKNFDVSTVDVSMTWNARVGDIFTHCLGVSGYVYFNKTGDEGEWTGRPSGFMTDPTMAQRTITIAIRPEDATKLRELEDAWLESRRDTHTHKRLAPSEPPAESGLFVGQTEAGWPTMKFKTKAYFNGKLAPPVLANVVRSDHTIGRIIAGDIEPGASVTVFGKITPSDKTGKLNCYLNEILKHERVEKPADVATEMKRRTHDLSAIVAEYCQ